VTNFATLTPLSLPFHIDFQPLVCILNCIPYLHCNISEENSATALIEYVEYTFNFLIGTFLLT
jgi:hypothetical protein